MGEGVGAFEFDGVVLNALLIHVVMILLTGELRGVV